MHVIADLMSLTKHGKRLAHTKAPGPSKKRKLAPQTARTTSKSTTKKTRVFERDTIPIPDVGDDVELSDQDLEVLEEYGGSLSFLNKLDQKGISRSKTETDRLHRLQKPPPRPPVVDDDLPSIDSHEDEGGLWSSDFDEDGVSIPDSSSANSGSSRDLSRLPQVEPDSDGEMAYETAPRKRPLSWDPKEKPGIQRLPIKLPDGRIQQTGRNVSTLSSEGESNDDSDEASDHEEQIEARKVEDISTGARFGRRSVVEVIETASRKKRIEAAKEQIAGICQEILAEPENGLGLLRRLHTFSLAQISTPNHPEPITNDVVVRKLSILSELAIYKDIIPGYRIRPLTDKEKAEKVSQMVMRTREWEQGLVTVYQSYLRALEAELKANTELSEVCLQCICTLAVGAAHFNFSINLMNCTVNHLSRRSWDKSSDLCLDTLIKVFRADLTGVTSLEVVRLLNQVIKAKRFNVNPNLLTCLLHLRLKTELNVRASKSKADKNQGVKPYSKRRAAERRARGKSTDQPHLSKKMKKALKEKKEIDKEFREAEAEVDKEERENIHTETLKLLFVLYFRILKNPKPERLLPAALQGISKFAHLVNIDFFQDLMQVLKDLIARDWEGLSDANGSHNVKEAQRPLLCIVTAFELLSGQGEALNIDLSDFVNRLYAIILPLSLATDIEAPLESSPSADGGDERNPPRSLADLLFRALGLIFSPRAVSPPWRTAAFAKRILIACMHWPAATTLRALKFVGELIVRDPKVEALLSTDDRTLDGIYRPEIDDPQLCNAFGTSFWELTILRQRHWDHGVREEAEKLAAGFVRS